MMVDLSSEKGVLKLSLLGSAFVASLGIAAGLVSGSGSILFDGVYSLLDAVMSLLSLTVVKLILLHSQSGRRSRRLQARFNLGLWHLEPMVIGLNGSLLIAAAVYALFGAIATVIDGGRDLQFGWALSYAVLVTLLCLGMALAERRSNRKIGSQFIALDMQGWLMSGAISSALILAFAGGLLARGTSLDWILPYIDPVALAVVCLLIIPVPVRTVARALGDMFLVTPPGMKAETDRLAEAFCEKHGFAGYRAYVARVGRSRMIELYFIVPADTAPQPIGHWDSLRDEIGAQLGGEGPDRWLTVVFTGDPEWAE